MSVVPRRVFIWVHATLFSAVLSERESLVGASAGTVNFSESQSAEFRLANKTRPPCGGKSFGGHVLGIT